MLDDPANNTVMLDDSEDTTVLDGLAVTVIPDGPEDFSSDVIVCGNLAVC